MTARLLAAAAVILLSGPAAAATVDIGRIFDIGRDVVDATKTVEEKDEIAIGREVTGRMLGAAPLVADPDLQSYVNRVGRWVAAQTERPDLPWRFGIIDSPSINAFAAPGGYVLITRGLYEILDSEAQLAGVLGHEIAHIVQRHHITVMQKSAAISAGARIAQRDGRSAIVNQLIGTGAEVFARGLDKSAEFESDRIGVVLAARAGYSPYGLVEVLHKLSVRAGDDASLALLFKTHPHPGERLSQLAEALEPSMAILPQGKEPPIRAVGADVPAAGASAPVPGGGARALQDDGGGTPQPAGKGSGIGIDPAGVLRGIFGR